MTDADRINRSIARLEKRVSDLEMNAPSAKAATSAEQDKTGNRHDPYGECWPSPASAIVGGEASPSDDPKWQAMCKIVADKETEIERLRAYSKVIEEESSGWCNTARSQGLRIERLEDELSAATARIKELEGEVEEAKKDRDAHGKLVVAAHDREVACVVTINEAKQKIELLNKESEKRDNNFGDWQNEVRSKIIRMTGCPDQSIDGAGSDGDEYEFTMSEICQGLAYVIDQRDELTKELAALKSAPVAASGDVEWITKCAQEIMFDFNQGMQTATLKTSENIADVIRKYAPIPTHPPLTLERVEKAVRSCSEIGIGREAEATVQIFRALNETKEGE